MYSSLALIFLLFNCAHLTLGQSLVSPCPRLFTYEPQTKNDRWYGVVTLITDSELSGIWLRLKLDRPAIQLGNWFGDVKTEDNMSFLIKNRNHKLPVNSPYPLRFYIQYDPSAPAPQVEYFRLNAKTFCPEGGGTTAPPTTSAQLMTSRDVSSTIKMPLAESTTTTTTTTTTFRPIDEQSIIEAVNIENLTERPFFIRPQIFIGHKPSSEQFYENAGEDEECGVLPAVAEPVISHGIKARVGEIPWHVAVYHTNAAGLLYACGGTLISRKHVVTAAHCVCNFNTENGDTLPSDQIVVYLGKDNLKDWSSSRYQLREVERVVTHPQYNTKTYENDIALIKMTSAAKFTNTVRPICLWEKDEDIDLLAGEIGIIAGFGYDETGKVANALIKTKMPVIKQTICVFSFPEFYSRYASQTTFCAGIINGTTVCNGDSGGGLIFSRKMGKKRVHYLRGIASIILRTLDVGDDRKCNPEHYPIFTDVAKYLVFIKTTMKSI